MTKSTFSLAMFLIFPQGDAFALKIVHRCFFPFDWGTQPDQFQHPVCPEDFDDDLSRNGATCLHGVTLDHCQLDSAAMRKVSQPTQLLLQFCETPRTPPRQSHAPRQ
jgi:hypothetical protein